MATILTKQTKKGARYTAQVRVRGHKLRSATFDTLTAAKRWGARIESDLQRGVHLPDVEARRRTLGELIDRYTDAVLPGKSESTQYGQTIQLTYWRDRLGHTSLAALTPIMIADERDNLLKGTTQRKAAGKLDRKSRSRKKGADLDEEKAAPAKRSPATVVRYIAVLSHCLEYARKELGWIDSNPARNVSKPKEPRGRVRILSEAERLALLEACRESKSPDLTEIVTLLLSTAARKNEILCLTWDHVDFQRRVITLHETKNGDRRVIPIRGEAERILIARSKIRRLDNPHVFPAPFRRGAAPKPLNIQAAWDWAVERAGLEDFRLHDLRHTAASTLAMNGATLAELAEVLGHRTLAMVQRYAHFTEGHTGGLMERLDAALFDPKKGKKGRQA